MEEQICDGILMAISDRSLSILLGGLAIMFLLIVGTIVWEEEERKELDYLIKEQMEQSSRYLSDEE